MGVTLSSLIHVSQIGWQLNSFHKLFHYVCLWCSGCISASHNDKKKNTQKVPGSKPGRHTYIHVYHHSLMWCVDEVEYFFSNFLFQSKIINTHTCTYSLCIDPGQSLSFIRTLHTHPHAPTRTVIIIAIHILHGNSKKKKSA